MTSRSLKVLLGASLLINVFLLGGIAGGTYRWLIAGRPPIAAAQQHALRFAARNLSPEHRQQFFQMLQQTRRELRPLAMQAREGRREVAQLLTAPQLDQPALDAALARTRAADVEMRTRIENAVVAFAATLSPDERQKLAKGLRQRGSFRLPGKMPAQQQ